MSDSITTDKKMGVSVLLSLFISSNEVCNTANLFGGEEEIVKDSTQTRSQRQARHPASSKHVVCRIISTSFLYEPIMYSNSSKMLSPRGGGGGGGGVTSYIWHSTDVRAE